MTLDVMLAMGADPLPIADGVEAFRCGWSKGWSIPAPMTVAEWADQYRVLPRAGGNESGPWRTARTPYMREIMECLSSRSPVREVVFMKSSQVGGTEALLNWCGYVIHHAPAPMMVVQPTVQMGEEWSKQRLANMIAESPALAEILPPSKARDSGNTTLSKAFPAGHLFIAGANSSSTLRSKPVKYLAMDEIDEYPDDLNDQGGAIELAERRTTTFPGRKILKVSTPTVKGASNIERAFNAGDQRRYHVPCPHCGVRQRLVIEQLTEDGQYLCEHCGVLIAEHHKPDMLAAGEWIPDNPGAAIRSYHINALYSPIGLGDTWAEIAQQRARARTDADFAITFTNTILGETYESESQKVDSSELVERREAWQRRTLPAGCLVLTVGIDVQHNRWSVLICGWGRGEVCWFVDWVEVPGDPTREEDWDALEEVVFAPIANRCGVPLRPEVVAVDSGNWTHEVYNWARKNAARGVIPIKGSKDPTKPIIGRPTLQDVNWRGRTQRHGVQLWTLGVNTAKSTLFARLMGDAGADADQRRCHIPGDMPEEFFRQITSERYDLTLKRWVVRDKSVRNEAFDCWVYAYAAAVHPRVRLHVRRDADWAALESKLEPAVMDLFTAPPENKAPSESSDDAAPQAVVRQSDPIEKQAAPARPLPVRPQLKRNW